MDVNMMVIVVECRMLAECMAVVSPVGWRDGQMSEV